MSGNNKEFDPKEVVAEAERVVKDHQIKAGIIDSTPKPEPYSQTTIPKEYEKTAVSHAKSIFDKAKIAYVQRILKGEQSVTVSTSDRQKQHALDDFSLSSRKIDRGSLLRPSQLTGWMNQFGQSLQNFRRPIAQAVDSDLITPSSYAKFTERLQKRIDKLDKITQEQRRNPQTRQISEGPMLTPLSKETIVEQNGTPQTVQRAVTLKLEDNQYIYEASETVDGEISFVSRWVTDAVNMKSHHILPRFTLRLEGESPQILNDPRFPTATAEAFIKTFDYVTSDENHWKNRAKRFLRRWKKSS